jgi:manganese/zinc/iron transport system permease protein
LLTQIQRSPTGNQSGLDKFLFGQAASMVRSDVQTLAIVAVVLCVLTAALYKEFKVLCFDGAFGRGLGLPIQLLDGVLMTMIVAAVVVGLQAVGVVLMAAMLITPPAAARFWTEKLHWMVILSAVFGGFSGAAGTLLSTLAPRMPTGPLIVLTATAVFVFSLLFAPRRGVVARMWRVVSTQRSVRRENLLRDLYELADAAHQESNGTGAWRGAAIQELLDKRRESEKTTRATLSQLVRMGWVKMTADRHWTLTPTGMRQAYEMVRRHRLWEMFLMYETTFGVPRVHRDADAVEHFLPPEVVGQLEELLRDHDLEPRLKPPAVAAS